MTSTVSIRTWTGEVVSIIQGRSWSKRCTHVHQVHNYIPRYAYVSFVAQHDLQNQFLDLGSLVKPTHLKWNQSKHESHTIDCSVWRSWKQLWQVHTIFFFLCFTTSSTNIQASVEKYCRTRWMSTFSSTTASGTRSGLHSTSSSSINRQCLMAFSATSLSTNHDKMATRVKRIHS